MAIPRPTKGANQLKSELEIVWDYLDSGGGFSISVLDHGALADAIVIEDAGINAASPTLNSASSAFTVSLIGLSVAVPGAGASGATLISTIIGVPSATSLTLNHNASTTVSASRAVYGTDNTPAFQAALDAAATSLITRTVFAPDGNYLLATDSLIIPQGVRLQGSWEYAPDHLGYRYDDEVKPMAGDGSTLVIVAGEGSNTGRFIFVPSQAAFRGFCVFYPAQLSSLSTAKQYPWTIEMFGMGATVEHVELVNPYQAIYSHIGQRHRIVDVKGQPLKAGLYASQILDSPIYSDINFFPFYTFSTTEESPYPLTNLEEYRMQNCVAFKFGRVDNALCTNLFTFNSFTGFKFVVDGSETTTFANGTGAPGGKAWARFVNCGADVCSYPLDVDDVAGDTAATAAGVAFDNGAFSAAQFEAFAGPPLYNVWMRDTALGRLGLTNCSFWLGVSNVVHEAGRLNVSNCFFQSWSTRAVTLIDAGSSTFTGNTFKAGNTSGGEDVVAAVGNPWTSWSGNMFEDTEGVVWDFSAATSTFFFNESGNTYGDGPVWTAPSLQNSWVNYGTYQVTLWKKRDGWVECVGVIKDGTATANTTLWTFPAGARPLENQLFDTGSGAAYALVQVATDGVVTIQAGSNVSLRVNFRFPIR